MARPSMAVAEMQPSSPRDSVTRERVVVAGLGRAGLEYACSFAMHPAAEVVGFVEPRGDLRRFARGIGFGVPTESSLGRWLDRRSCDVDEHEHVWIIHRPHTLLHNYEDGLEHNPPTALCCRMAPPVLLRARSSITWPNSTSTVIAAAVS